MAEDRHTNYSRERTINEYLANEDASLAIRKKQIKSIVRFNVYQTNKTFFKIVVKYNKIYHSDHF